MRKVIFSLILLSFILVFLPGIATAFQDDVERYSTSYTEKYTLTGSSTGGGGYTVTASTGIDPQLTQNNVLTLNANSNNYDYRAYNVYAYLIPIENSSSPYFSVISTGYGPIGLNGISTGFIFKVIRPSDSAIIAQFSDTSRSNYPANTKIEIIKVSSNYELYINGTKIETVSNQIPAYTGEVKYCVGTVLHKGTTEGSPFTAYIRYDDFSDSSIIGSYPIITESNTNMIFTWSSQLMRSYEEQQKITLYSLTNQNNTGKITSWDIPQEDNSDKLEHGYLNFSRSDILSDNYGLYMLEMTRGEDILYDQYFYYDQISNPQGYPEILLLAESDVNAEIRDEDLNGGEITGGDSVYLFPAVRENGSYVIECKILETPYGIRTEFTKVYSNVPLNETTIHYSGLLNQNYLVSLDGSIVGNTTGLDTFDTVLTWTNTDNHIITFNPDFTLPGIWGYVKNSISQNPIKAATVIISNQKISNQNGTQYLYTDSNGMYYLTKGMEIGTYNVSASKIGYSNSIPFVLQTQAGATTRKDIFLDKASGDGTYYQTHDVTFNVLEYWYSSIGLPGLPYSVTDEAGEVISEGYTDSKGKFTIEDMSEGTNYTFDITYNNSHHIEYIEPALTDYNIVLNNQSEIVHTYYNSWLNLSYTDEKGNITLLYDSNKTISAAALIIKAANGSTFYTGNKSTQTGTWNVNLSAGEVGDYIINFNITASDGDTAFQSWAYSKAPKVPLFPDSYPAWLKNTLYGAIIIIFLLAFGKSKNDIACASAAVLSSLGYYFGWLSCSFYFVVLIWIIALAACYLHYKRTGALG